MRPLRNFKTNQCCHRISRIANRAFFLNDEEKATLMNMAGYIDRNPVKAKMVRWVATRGERRMG